MSQEMSFALAIRVSSKKAIKASQVGTLHVSNTIILNHGSYVDYGLLSLVDLFKQH